MLKLGHNFLHGTMPLLLHDKTQTQTTDNDQPTNCTARNPFKKIGLQWLEKNTSPSIEPLTELQTLSLNNNHLTGTIYTEINLLLSLEYLNLGK